MRSKRAKYCSLIVDSTPDISHTEQVSLTIRTVAVHSVAVKITFYVVP